MNVNQIRFTPKQNAAAQIYTDITGVPAIGDMMAACEQPTDENEPAEPTDENTDGEGD